MQTQATSAAPSGASAATLISPAAGKKQFLDAFSREHAITMKLLRAFPSAKSDFRPHERSNSARQLAWTFVIEQQLIMAAITDTLKIGGSLPPAPDDYDAIVSQFERDFAKTRDLLQSATDAQLSSLLDFPTGPKQMAKWPKLDFLWFILSDQIHHRGQLSVYVRLAGGKVPSIYGPSADEPWM
jgi:uncharacterized damage-inducible protein DinB